MHVLQAAVSSHEPGKDMIDRLKNIKKKIKDPKWEEKNERKLQKHSS